MTGFFLKFGLLLLCSICHYSEGLGKDECPDPNTTKCAEYYMDQYVVGTWARYYCDEGYKRKAGITNIIRCKNVSGVVQWISSSQPVCIGLPPTEKWENSSTGPQISTRTSTAAEGFCGTPVRVEHATVKVTKYKLGQKLTFKYLNESQVWVPGTGIITCENSSGVAAWSSLNPQCTDEVHLTSGEQRLNPAILCIMAAGTMVFIL
ncbi:interleukin-15 receptor subunit alpha-like [Ahaetulla prasina]|uniref:interleukin-15 receptor subunit alpha-like n=1 Tax=Ahaetulla prasina TaxID=499056 RepID=UPI00264723C6|nr:interleukin-15 receptor subunit alpha-like [Ahaetulla prasina]